MLNIYRFFYTALFVPVVLFISIFSKKLRAGTKIKLGGYNFKLHDRTLWIHAVSVGEVMLAATLISKIERNVDIVLTTSTPQGQELAKNKLSNRCREITYFPYDTTYALKSAINAINPFAAVIVETEIWPNFASQLYKQNIPLYIVNGRISERTYKSYLRLKFFFKEIFKNYRAILTQSEDDAMRFINIGAEKNKVVSSGNIKFDLQKPDEKIKTEYQNIFKTNGKNVLIFGSTHGDENAALIEVYKKLKEKINNLKLIIAPRHLEKTSQIEGLLNGLSFSKRSLGANFDINDVIILDTTGELGKTYSIADIAVIGGSFNNTGGHNPLEATIWNKPAITGPNIKNFRYIYKTLCELDCAFKVKDTNETEQIIYKLLTEKKYMDKIQSNCAVAIEKNSGATDFTIKFLFNGEENGKQEK